MIIVFFADCIFTITFTLFLQEEIVFETTSSAVENLKTYLAQNNIESAVRISLMQGG